MVSITLSVSEEVKKTMESFPEMNWSGFVRKSILEKTSELKKREELLNELEKEKDISDWSVKLQRVGRKGRLEELRKRGLI